MKTVKRIIICSITLVVLGGCAYGITWACMARQSATLRTSTKE